MRILKLCAGTACALITVAFLFSVPVRAAIPQAERDALLALYNGTGGPSWTNHANWGGAPGTENTWYGVTTDAGNTTVQQIWLQNNNLTGPLPSQVGNLTNLVALILNNNKLSGSIPVELGNLSHLQGISLYANLLTGPIPASLGNLVDLQALILSSNQLSGPIPPSLGNLTKVTNLNLNTNQLSGTIPSELGNLAAVTELYLHSNQLTGPIPPELGNLGHLQRLVLRSNQLTGSIPTELGNLGSLLELSLRDNQLTGAIPASLGSLSNLQFLRLCNNQLSGPLPAELGNLHQLQNLEAYQNQLTGSIPSSFGGLTSLVVFDVFTNQLSGPIPPELAALTNLAYLNFGGNNLTGGIPAWLGSLTNLGMLSLWGNQLTGSIPPELGSLTNLYQLEIGRNPLTGTLPPELGNMSNLQYLWIYETNITGGIPSQLGNLSKLKKLDLDSNQLTGPIPTSLGNLSNLQLLDLDTNQLTGTIPTQLANLTQLQELDLDFNQLTGSIPTTMPNVYWLALNDNQLTGSIPSQLGSLTNLYGLHLENNQLTGTIPHQLGSLPILADLNVSRNQLTGSIPLQLGNLAGLQGLVLDYNQLSGTIPTQLGNLSNLRGLWLDHNQLSGTIPTQLGSLSQLQALYVNNNLLTGTIPVELANLANLQALFVADNQLTGAIPHQLGSLSNLVGLGLQRNSLTGTIPVSLGNLPVLQNLYLDDNHLAGAIPPELGSLGALIELDLSGNQLSGPMPSQLGALANLKLLFVNGNQLSGAIPASLQDLTALPAGGLDLRWNALHSADPGLVAFLNTKQLDGNWQSTQTVAPAGVTVSSSSPATLQVSWTPIAYTADPGGYAVSYSTAPGGPYASYDMTADKAASSMLMTALAPGATYCVVVSTFTVPHAYNQNTVVSEYGTEACAATCAGPPVILAHPASQVVPTGTAATLTVTATGTGALSYQWYQGPSGDVSAPVGADQSSFTTPALLTSSSYWVKVADGCGSTSSITATVSVCTPPSIATEPQGATISSGQSGWLSVTASGSAPFSYQWYRGAAGDTSAPVGTNASTYTTPALTATTSYWVRVSNGCGSPADSITATFVVCVAPAITVQPQSVTIPTGTSTTLSVTATGTPAPSYQWYQGLLPDTSLPVGGNSATFTTPALTQTTRYWVRLDNTCGPPVHSVTASITVCAPPTITAQPQGTTIASGATATLTVVADGDAPLAYQWYRGAAGDTSTPAGSGASSFTTPALTQTTSYWVRVSNGCGMPADSATATVAVCAPPSITTQPQDSTVAPGETQTLTVVATGTAPLHYQWYQGSSGDEGAPVGGDSPTYTTPAIVQTTSYWVRVSNGCGSPADSATATVSMCPPPSITAQPADGTVSAGGSVTLTVTATGPQPLSYEWYQGATGTTSTPVGTGSASYTTPALTQTTSFWVRIRTGCGSHADSVTATVTVCTAPFISIQPQDATVMSGGTATLTVVASGSSPLSYQWFRGAAGDTSSPVGGDSAGLTTPSLSQATSYWVRVSNGCGTPADSRTATVWVCTLTCSASAPAIGSVGLPVDFTGSALLAGACAQTIVYDWDFGDGSSHSAQQSPSHTYTSAATRTWAVTVTAGSLTCTRNGTITVVVGPGNLTMKKLTPPFTIVVTGTNLQSGVRAFIDGTEWTATTYKAPTKKKPAKLKLTGGKALKAVVPQGAQKVFRFLNPDGGEAFMTWGW